MNYGVFKGCVQLAGLGIKDFANYVGMNHRSISNYSKHGDVPDHLAIIALLLMELKKHDVEIGELFAKINQNGRRLKKLQKGEFKGRGSKNDN